MGKISNFQIFSWYGSLLFFKPRPRFGFLPQFSGALQHSTLHTMLKHSVYVVYRCSSSCRLWYVKDSETETTEDELDRRSDNLVPIEIGYMNVIPKCVDWTGRYPIYENLPETYAAIDAYLSGSPLEGKKEGRKDWMKYPTMLVIPLVP